MSSVGSIRTVRIRTRRKIGNLGLLTTALGDSGASIGEITTISIGHTFTIRDFHLVLEDEDHISQVRQAIEELADSSIVDIRNEVKAIHDGGKIRTRSLVQFDDVSSLQTAYHPGVKEIVHLINEDPSLVQQYTSIQRTVAVVSDGAGLQSVGKIRTSAMLPILEAKAALLAEVAGLNSLPLVLDVDREDQFIETVQRISASCGAVLLDALGAPRSLRIQQRLGELLDIPVFDDDSDGPAVSVLAAVINACHRAGIDIAKAKIGQLGLGAAGGAGASLIMKYTQQPVFGEDVHPATLSRHIHQGGKESSLEEIMGECDVVVANTGHGGVIPPHLVRKGQVILALSEPFPEIEPYDALLAGAAFAADGKAVNKAVIFPGLLLGALAVGATSTHDDMNIAAAVALAKAAEDSDLLPTPLTPGIHARIGSAVAMSALASGYHTIDPECDLSPQTFQQVITGKKQLPLKCI
jgi:malate dehydrogenase (oxaloacetate-decarboxylating)